MDKSRKSFREFLELSENKKRNPGKKIDGTKATRRGDVEGAASYKAKSQEARNRAKGRDAQEKAIRRWQKENGLEGTNVMPPWYKK